MIKDNVDTITTGMNPVTDVKNNRPVLRHREQALLITDILFVLRLFNRFTSPSQTRNVPLMYLPDILVMKLSEPSRSILRQWKEQGLINVTATGAEAFDDIRATAINS